MKIILTGLMVTPFLISFIYGLRTGRAWVKPKSLSGGRRRFRWVDRYKEPFWFWGAIVAYLAAAGCIVFFLWFV